MKSFIYLFIIITIITITTITIGKCDASLLWKHLKKQNNNNNNNKLGNGSVVCVYV